MVERILAQQQPICATLLEVRKGDLMPSDDEFATMESFVKTMKPLVKITEVMGAEKWITISAVRPLLHQAVEYISTTIFLRHNSRESNEAGHVTESVNKLHR